MTDTLRVLELILEENRLANKKLIERIDIVATNQGHILQAVARLGDRQSENEEKLREVERVQKAIAQHPALSPAE